MFPAAILQPPFFDVDADDAVNYGAIGAVIGHEISHGFDDQGRQFDGDGNLRDWWTPADAQEFEARAAGSVAQYDGLRGRCPGLNVNGELTLGENIGDLSGLAHRATARITSRCSGQAGAGDRRLHRRPALLPRLRAGLAREDARRGAAPAAADRPALARPFRVNGPLVNIPEFYRAFDVKDTDRMWVAPDQRTRIW